MRVAATAVKTVPTKTNAIKTSMILLPFLTLPSGFFDGILLDFCFLKLFFIIYEPDIDPATVMLMVNVLPEPSRRIEVGETEGVS